MAENEDHPDPAEVERIAGIEREILAELKSITARQGWVKRAAEKTEKYLNMVRDAPAGKDTSTAVRIAREAFATLCRYVQNAVDQVERMSGRDLEDERVLTVLDAIEKLKEDEVTRMTGILDATEDGNQQQFAQNNQPAVAPASRGRVRSELKPAIPLTCDSTPSEHRKWTEDFTSYYIGSELTAAHGVTQATQL